MLAPKYDNDKVKEKLTLEFLAFRPHRTSLAGSPEGSILHLGSWSVLGPLWSFLPEVFLNAFWSSAHFGPRSSFRTPPQIHIWQDWRATILLGIVFCWTNYLLKIPHRWERSRCGNTSTIVDWHIWEKPEHFWKGNIMHLGTSKEK